jgi:NADPH:quinone reductase-like Zn-dependent oxidoreductase
MKAAVYRSYGPPEVLQIEEVQQPSMEDMDDRVLIKVSSASVNPFDILHRKGYFPVRPSNGFVKPKEQILGIDVAGTIEAVGNKVTIFKIGDRVFGNCLGSHAEYVRARPERVSLMPGNLTFYEAAVVPTAALTALQALRDVAHIQKGQKVLINGASGGVGHFAVQFARYFEAEVTAICSTANLAWVKSLGAQEVIDYTRTDFTCNGRKYDVVLDATATRTFFNCKHSLSERGIYITENPLKPNYQIGQVLLGLLTRDQRLRVAPLTRPNNQDLDFIAELIEAGKIRPVIETCYPLEQIADAHRHVECGHAKGKIVLNIQNG